MPRRILATGYALYLLYLQSVVGRTANGLGSFGKLTPLFSFVTATSGEIRLELFFTNQDAVPCPTACIALGYIPRK